MYGVPTKLDKYFPSGGNGGYGLGCLAAVGKVLLV